MEDDGNRAVYFATREEWRSWLEGNFDKEKEIWLIYPHRSSGRPRIVYNDAVEEALCFGWIDSTVKKYDHESSMQKFTPRSQGSSYSQPNKERLKWLLERNMVHPSLIDNVREVANEEFVFPDDIIDAIREDKAAWKNYQNFSESYKRLKVAYIDDARKRPEEFEKRLNNFIKKTRENKQFGYGGIEKYF
ncbi:MAG: YdeI/OmpD-associated family protein [Thermoplasmatota archaeon]